MMPGKTGLNVLQFLKGDAKLKSIPVIVVSGAAEITGVDLTTGEQDETSGEDIVAQKFGEVIHEKLQQFKPDGIVEKPVDPDLLVSTIKKLMG